jgi:hypothetical protein
MVVSQDCFAPRYSRFARLFRNLDARSSLELTHLVDHSERGLGLARDEVGSNAKYVNLVIVSDHLPYSFFIDII